VEKVGCLLVLCPTCQTENPGDVRDCRACSSPLPDLERTQAIHPNPSFNFRDVPTAEISTRNESVASSLDLASNSAFGPRYKIESLLGQGGMGKVYRAYDRELNRNVALKLVRPELAADPHTMARFRQELLLASKISHRNVLRIHDLGDVDGVKFISMTLVEGLDLHDAIAQSHGPLPFPRALNIALQLCSALDAAHAEGVIHRDLKPRNILLDAADHVYVTDFGLAKSVETEAAAMTRTGDFIGTPLYMSPEQIESKPVDHRTDLYSLGLIFYEMVTGDLPFAGKSSVQVMHSRMTTAPKDPKSLAPGLPDYFACVIAKCLARDPQERYQSAAEIRRDLEKSIAPRRKLLARLPKPNRTWAVVGAAMAIAVGVTVAVPAIREKLFTPAIPTVSGPAYFLAILPFKPLGSNPELKYQAEGIVEALNAKLFPLKQVNLASQSNIDRVVALGSPDQTAIAKQLGANLIVQGNMQRGGDRLAINVSAWSAKTGSVVWKQNFECTPENLLITEDKIYNDLVENLKLKLSSQELAQGAARATEDSEAYDLYMRGRSLMRGRPTAANYQASLDLFDKAISRDYRFARAYAGIAESSFGLYRSTKDPKWTERGLGAAREAFSLDPQLPDVHLVVGRGYLLTGRISEAISEFKRVVELAPSSDEAYRNLGNAYRDSGNKDLAIVNLKKAIAINPYYSANFNALGLAETKFGNRGAAIAAYKKVIKLQPDYSGGYSNLGSIYYRQGNWNDSLPLFRKALELDNKSPQNYQNLGVLSLYLGNFAESVRLLEKARDLGQKGYLNFGNLGDAYSATGQPSKAADAYKEAIKLALEEDHKLNSKNPETLGDLALYHAEIGDTQQAINFINRARSIDANNESVMYLEGVILHLAGKDDQALPALKKSFASGYPARVAANEFALRTLRTNPEFQKLLAAYHAS